MMESWKLGGMSLDRSGSLSPPTTHPVLPSLLSTPDNSYNQLILSANKSNQLYYQATLTYVRFIPLPAPSIVSTF